MAITWTMQAGAIARAEPHPFWWLGLPLAIAAALLVASQGFPARHERWVEGELGALELGQLLVLVWAFWVALRLVLSPGAAGRPWLRAWLALAVLGCFYAAGEEASWGQHFFGWSTPEGWRALNKQGETNLHNVSSWFNMKPRLLLEVGVIFGGIGGPVLAYLKPAILHRPAAIILPSMICLPSALLAETTALVEHLVKAAGQVPSNYLGLRASEVQELYFYVFVLLYLLALRQRLQPPGAAGRSAW